MKIDIDNNILENNDITTRRSTPTLAIIIIFAAAILFALLPSIEDTCNAKLAIIVVAIIMTVYGIAKIISMPTVMVYDPTNEILHYEELYFDAKEKNSVMDMIHNSEIKRLRSQAKDSNNHPLMVELYITASESAFISRVYHYVPYSYEPLTEYEVYTKKTTANK